MKPETNGAPSRSNSVPPTVRRVGALTKLPHVRDELAKLYRDARSGRVDAVLAGRLGYLLDLLRRVITDETLVAIERRLAAVEARANDPYEVNRPDPIEQQIAH